MIGNILYNTILTLIIPTTKNELLLLVVAYVFQNKLFGDLICIFAYIISPKLLNLDVIKQHLLFSLRTSRMNFHLVQPSDIAQRHTLVICNIMLSRYEFG